MSSSIGEDDSEVRTWCRASGVYFQPYASARNEKEIKNVSPKTAAAINRIALKHAKSTHAVIYRYFLQSGDAIIPRSANLLHLMENIANLKWSLTADEMKELSQLTLVPEK